MVSVCPGVLGISKVRDIMYFVVNLSGGSVRVLSRCRAGANEGDTDIEKRLNRKAASH